MELSVSTIVVGLGAMGSATVYQLAKRGHSVVGLDQFDPPHARGSTHGETRITRCAIGEGAHLSPFAIRSHQIWREIERETGRDLLTLTGLLVISSESGTATMHVPEFLSTTVAAARAYDIPHELLDAAGIRRRFPPFAVRDEESGYFEPGAGFVRPEACIAAQLSLARKHGAAIHTGVKVLGLEQVGSRVAVRTETATWRADHVILTVGPWLPELVSPEFNRVFSITRQVLYWFAPRTSIEPFLPDWFPVYIWEPVWSAEGVYGFPGIDGPEGGVKVAPANYGEATVASEGSRPVTPEEISAVYERLVGPCFPQLSSRCIKAKTCLYTVTPDHGFVIDRHPGLPGVLLVSPCSGHGFKHSAAIGESVAQLVAEGKSRLDLSPFRLSRFGGG
jgi:sarcosine oxidase